MIIGHPFTETRMKPLAEARGFMTRTLLYRARRQEEACELALRLVPAVKTRQVLPVYADPPAIGKPVDAVRLCGGRTLWGAVEIGLKVGEAHGETSPVVMLILTRSPVANCSPIACSNVSSAWRLLSRYFSTSPSRTLRCSLFMGSVG